MEFSQEPKGFLDSQCPLGPVSEFEKDSRSLYFAPLFHRQYQGRYEPQGGKRGYAPIEPSEGVLEYKGICYRRVSGPDIVWHQALDDVNYLSLKMGRKPRPSPRHFHTDFLFRRRRVHIDYVKSIQWGPLSGVEEVIVFSESRFVTRGGHWGMPPAGGLFNWPLTCPIGKGLITIDFPVKVTDMKLIGPQVRFWTLRNKLAAIFFRPGNSIEEGRP